MPRGVLFVVSAPSGTGKTTAVEKLVERMPDLALSRSYTSRQARQGERDGVDYNFVSRERFERMIAENEFLEYADVFGNLYGTCASDTEAALVAGRDLVLVIDVQGAEQVRQRGLALVSVFVLPPSYPILEQRLRGRSKDSDAADPPPARRGAAGSHRLLRLRLRDRQRRSRAVRRRAARDRHGRTEADAPGAAGGGTDRRRRSRRRAE